MKTTSAIILALLWASLLISGCGCGDSKPHDTGDGDTDIDDGAELDVPVDSTPDIMPDTDSDIETDVDDDSPDAPTDAPADMTTDDDEDILTDGPVDVIEDTATDGSEDAPEDSSSDAETDGATDAPTDSVTDLTGDAPTDVPTDSVTEVTGDGTDVLSDGAIGCTDDGDCADPDACNGAETCSAGGICQAGTPLMCNDANPCNGEETCDPSSGCVGGMAADPGTPCPDGNLCNGDEICDGAGTCDVGFALVCDDGQICNGPEICDPATGCGAGTDALPGTGCPDDDLCNGDEICDGAGLCVAGLILACDDENPCNGAEICDPATGCVAGTDEAPGTACPDGDLCNGDETCDGAGSCDPGTALSCDDTMVCNGAEICDPATGCVAGTDEAPGTACPDGDLCNGNETCDGAGSCVPGSPLGCDDDNECTTDSCDAVTGCDLTPIPGFSCNDHDACTNPDVCRSDGTCSGSPISCDDGFGCTVDGCDSSTGCTHAPDDSLCDDLIDCSSDRCVPGTGCVNTEVNANCEDGVFCSLDFCSIAAGGCLSMQAPDGMPCEDPCIIDGACNTSGECVGRPVLCNDGDRCTTDLCDPDTGCSHVAIPNVNAVHFDNSCIVFPGLLDTPAATEQMTIEFWYRAESSWSSKTVFDKRFDTGAGIFLETTCCDMRYLEPASQVVAPPIAAGTWHHVAYVRDGPLVAIYWNGALTYETSGFPQPISQSTAQFYLGCRYRETADVLQDFLGAGWIDELRVSNIARYDDTEPSFTPSVHSEPDMFTIGLYHFDDPNPALIEDSSGYDNHGLWVAGTPAYSTADAEMCP